MSSRSFASPSQPSIKSQTPLQALQFYGVLRPRGQTVVVRAKSDGFFYPGVVQQNSHSDQVLVELVDGQLVEAQHRHIILVGGAEPCPTLCHNDSVLVRVRASHGAHSVNGQCDFYVPGTVCGLPDGVKPSTAAFSVLVYNGRVVTCSRRGMIKISVSMYSETCRYIESVLSTKSTMSANSTGSPKVAPSEVSQNWSSKSFPKSSQIFPRFTSDLGMSVCRITSAPMRHNCRGVTSCNELAHSRSTTSHSQKNLRKCKSNDSVDFHHSAVHEAEALLKEWRRFQSEKSAEKRKMDAILRSSSTLNNEIGCFKKSDNQQNDDIDIKNISEGENEWNEDDVLSDGGGLANGVMKHAVKIQGESQRVKTEWKLRTEKDFRISLFSKSLPSISTRCEKQDKTGPYTNEYVLAKCTRSGWYYRAIIKQRHGDMQYEVVDRDIDTSCVSPEMVHEKDLIFNCQDGSTELEVGRTVLAALHPRQECFAPGIVKGMSRDNLLYYIQFHDRMKVPVLYLDVFPLDPVRYQADVEFLQKKGRELVGSDVIARRNRDGLFYEGKVVEQVVEGSTYLMQWKDGSSQLQHSINIFGVMTRDKPFQRGDYILAPKPGKFLNVSNLISSFNLVSDKSVYMPSTIKYIASDRILVKFIDEYM